MSDTAVICGKTVQIIKPLFGAGLRACASCGGDKIVELNRFPWEGTQWGTPQVAIEPYFGYKLKQGEVVITIFCNHCGLKFAY